MSGLQHAHAILIRAPRRVVPDFAGQEYIRSGELDATSYQDVPKAVSKILEVCVGLVNGQTFDKEINPQNYFPMTIDNIDELVGSAAK